VNDDNIREARHKIAYDLWEAANDPELISRMGCLFLRRLQLLLRLRLYNAIFTVLFTKQVVIDVFSYSYMTRN